MRVHPLAPVLALDVDGTLGDYHSHFRWFAELYLQCPVVPRWAAAPTGEFSQALGLDKHTYRDIKLAYRQGGMKRCLPMIDPDTGWTVQYLREVMGVQVWITTTRPWNRLDNIDPDTRFWIERNIGQVDGVIYGEDKYADLVDIVGKERILGVFDDLPENIERARALGLPAVLATGAHNAWWQRKVEPWPEESAVGRTLFRARSITGALPVFEKWIDDLKETRS